MSSNPTNDNVDPQPVESGIRELSVLWTQSHGLVLSYIRSVIVDYHQADDVLQETAATIAEKFGEYDRGRPFVAWALGIAKYKILESLRSHGRDKLVFNEQVTEVLATAFVEMQPRLSETHVALENCLGKVKGRSKILIERRYLREESVDTLAKATGMTSTAVRVALHRIRKLLLQCIQDQLASAAGRV